MPAGEGGPDARRVGVDLGEAARHRPRVEVGGVDALDLQLAGQLEAEVEEALALRGVVVDERGDVVEPLLPGPVHLAVDGRCVVVLLDELDLEVAEIAEGVRHVGLL
jgi:hypothetical protein